MSLINNQTNRVYLENEVYNKTRELKKLENNYMVDLASYKTRCEMLRDQIDSMQSQIDTDDKNKANRKGGEK